MFIRAMVRIFSFRERWNVPFNLASLKDKKRIRTDGWGTHDLRFWTISAFYPFG